MYTYLRINLKSGTFVDFGEGSIDGNPAPQDISADQFFFKVGLLGGITKGYGINCIESYEVRSDLPPGLKALFE
jgi:hypothetical protein